jgi:hypothetical protein
VVRAYTIIIIDTVEYPVPLSALVTQSNADIQVTILPPSPPTRAQPISGQLGCGSCRVGRGHGIPEGCSAWSKPLESSGVDGW